MTHGTCELWKSVVAAGGPHCCARTAAANMHTGKLENHAHMHRQKAHPVKGKKTWQPTSSQRCRGLLSVCACVHDFPRCLLTSYICTTMPLLFAGAISARYAGTTMADAPIPSPTSKRPATRVLRVWHKQHPAAKTQQTVCQAGPRIAAGHVAVGNSAARMAIAASSATADCLTDPACKRHSRWPRRCCHECWPRDEKGGLQADGLASPVSQHAHAANEGAEECAQLCGTHDGFLGGVADVVGV